MMSKYKERMFRDLGNRYFVVKADMSFIGKKFLAFSEELILHSTFFFCSLIFLSLL